MRASSSVSASARDEGRAWGEVLPSNRMISSTGSPTRRAISPVEGASYETTFPRGLISAHDRAARPPLAAVNQNRPPAALHALQADRAEENLGQSATVGADHEEIGIRGRLEEHL